MPIFIRIGLNDGRAKTLLDFIVKMNNAHLLDIFIA